MKSIMKDDFGVTKAKKVNISYDKDKIFITNKIINFIIKNTEKDYNESVVRESVKEIYGNIEEVDVGKEDENESMATIIRNTTNVLRGEANGFKNTNNYHKFLSNYSQGEVEPKVNETVLKDAEVSLFRANYGDLFTDGRANDKGKNLYIAVSRTNGFEDKVSGNIFKFRNSNIKYLFVNADKLHVISQIHKNLKGNFKDYEELADRKLKKIKESKVYKVNEDYKEDIEKKIEEVYRRRLLSLNTLKPNERKALMLVYFIDSVVIDDVFNHLEYANSQHINYVQMVNYAKQIETGYATVYMTKKNINKEHLEEMKKSPFLKYFSYVELDDDTDLKKYRKVIEMFEEDIKNLPKIPKVELRFRKLGRHKAKGLYFPSMRCIAIDIRTVDSFIHEYAHAFDYTKMYSLQEDFYSIVSKYRQNYRELLSRTDDDYYKNKADYYLTTTEIFARAFEIAYRLKGHKSFLVSDNESMKTIPYLAFQNIQEEVETYFKDKIK